jgi:hypothetical protein
MTSLLLLWLFGAPLGATVITAQECADMGCPTGEPDDVAAEPNQFIILEDSDDDWDQIIFQIDQDGKMTLGKDLKPDEAARLFIEHVKLYWQDLCCPCKPPPEADDE